jgi:hypothetical protein
MVARASLCPWAAVYRHRQHQLINFLYFRKFNMHRTRTVRYRRSQPHGAWCDSEFPITIFSSASVVLLMHTYCTNTCIRIKRYRLPVSNQCLYLVCTSLCRPYLYTVRFPSSYRYCRVGGGGVIAYYTAIVLDKARSPQPRPSLPASKFALDTEK